MAAPRAIAVIGDSLLADLHPSIGYRKGKYEPRTRSPVAIVVHTTGAGPWRRLTEPRFARWRRRNGDPRDTYESAIRIYQSVTTAGPHYVVGQEAGQIAQLCPEDLCAWHVGGKGGSAYARPRAKWLTSEARWWELHWPHLQSPRQLADGQMWTPYGAKVGARVAWTQWRAGGSVNANSIGIEVACPPDDPRAPWSDAAWSSLVEVIHDIAIRHAIPTTRDRIVSHSDTHPLARSTGGWPWDPSTRQWTWRRYSQISGAPY